MTPSEPNPRDLSFSQAQGYSDLPRPLQLEELSSEVRNLLWSVLYEYVDNCASYDMVYECIHEPWVYIVRHLHITCLVKPLDEFSDSLNHFVKCYKPLFLNPSSPFNRVFDVLQEVMRHPNCPPSFIEGVSSVFSMHQLAYIVDTAYPVTILPAATPEEGQTVAKALKDLDSAGLPGAAKHLRSASVCVTNTDWPGAVRESIHAVESVARRIEPSAKTLGPALAALEKRNILHPAMKTAFSKLYGYTSDEQGIRHALFDKPEADVGQDEAVFMLGACAAFSSYLFRKHQALSE